MGEMARCAFGAGESGKVGRGRKAKMEGVLGRWWGAARGGGKWSAVVYGSGVAVSCRR